jgi:hypothetical protein
VSLVTVNEGTIGVVFTDILTADGVVPPGGITAAIGLRFTLRDFEGNIILDAVASIDDALNNEVSYTTVAGDLEPDGTYRQHWIVDYGAGVTETYPSMGANTVRIQSVRGPLGPAAGACAPWINWEDVACDVDLSALPGGADRWQDLIVSAATNTLYERSCRQFGLCDIDARPVPCCRHKRPFCACGRYDYVRLGEDPIAEIRSVTIDGTEVDPSTYRVDDWTWLVRTGGKFWPRCNDLSVGDDEPGSFHVAWSYGLEVPPEGVIAAGLLACKYARDVVDACTVPGNAQTISREGVTIQLAPPKPGQSLGVKFVDDWLSQFNCGGGMFDPGARRQFLRTNTTSVPTP